MPRRLTSLAIACFAGSLLLPASALAACPKPGWVMTTPNSGLVAKVWTSTCDVESPADGQLKLKVHAGAPHVGLRYRVDRSSPYTLVRFPANHVAIVQAGPQVQVSVAGRRVATLHWPGHDWTLLSASIDLRAKRLTVAVDRHRKRIALHRAHRERQVELGKDHKRPLPDSAAPPRLFAPDSVWNQRFDGASVALAPNSAALVAELQRSTVARTPWVNTTNYSVPLYRVGPSQRLVRVVLTTSWRPLQAEWDAVPIPDNALPAVGNDGHLVVYQAATDTLWEFYHLARVGNQWMARWGGRIVGVSKSPGYYTGAERTQGATATSLSLAGGLMTLDELRTGHIDHALAMAVPYARRGMVVFPAQRGDGYVSSDAAIPEGTRFRLDPTFDLNTLKGPPIIRMMAEAAQRYGMLVRDQSADVSFYAEDPRQFGASPFWGTDGYYANQYPNNFLRRYFPWSRMQVVAPPASASAAAKAHS